MKLSRTSWHYRMISHFPWKIQSTWYTYSLCQYFWLVVWTFVFCLIVVPIMAVGTLFAAAVVAAVVFYPILQFFIESWPPWAFLSAIVDTILLMRLWFWYRKKYVGRDKCSETASLVAEYVSAKHRKVCPLLDFE